jgi:hypothetical protein
MVSIGTIILEAINGKIAKIDDPWIDCSSHTIFAWHDNYFFSPEKKHGYNACRIYKNQVPELNWILVFVYLQKNFSGEKN